jgi:hypothetical protein
MERMPDHLNPKLGQLKNGTTLRHVYKSGKYEGEEVTASVKGERIDVRGDAGPDNSDFSTRTPMGAARVADRHFRGSDARDSNYDGWGWWEYENDDGEWVPIRELPEWNRP